MPRVLFITHPEVSIDPQVPVAQWGLSPTGLARMTTFSRAPMLRGVDRLFCSKETKAIAAARVLASPWGLVAVEDAALGENDRTATGFLHRDAFEAAADAFFAQPLVSWRGWERAVDAQHRIVDAVTRLLREHPGDGDVAIVSHGAVGTLLKCHLKGIGITRREDQPSQGHWYAFAASDGALMHDWRPLGSTH